VAVTERSWVFDGYCETFRITVEARQIDLAFLFDPMMKVHTSNVDPLHHRITAVYESMLPRQPLRFVPADYPDAGKTIMAGMYMRELIMSADSRRILVVAPGSLVEQWRDEMFEKFGLEFWVYSKDPDAATATSNPFEDIDHLVLRLDKISGVKVSGTSEAKEPGPIQSKLLETGWDLVIFDEAHELAAHYFGPKLEKTARFRFAEGVGARTRHLPLMEATPHDGKEEEFQLFFSLLDSGRC
jgi:SNF2 family DNA or RNA helicase